MKNRKEIYEFKKGSKIHLDEIYAIQGLADGDWWDREDPEDDLDDNLVVTRDLRIEIIYSNAEVSDHE